jgi:hypothetical protein
MNESSETHKFQARNSLWGLVLMVLFASCRSGATDPPAAARASAPVAAEVEPAAIRITVPDAGWQLRVERIYEQPTEIWILVHLERRPGMAAQMITHVEAKLPVAVPAKPQKVFVTGKTWAWKNEEPYEFVPSFGPVLRQVETAKLLFPAEKD